jgi:hypothetical protein
MMEENNLTLVGVTWMTSQFDAFVREIYVTAGMTPRCAACHEVPGYSDPCPHHVSAAVPVINVTPLALCVLLALAVLFSVSKEANLL